MRAATLFSQVIDFPAFSSINRGEPPGSDPGPGPEPESADVPMDPHAATAVTAISQAWDKQASFLPCVITPPNVR